MQKQVIKPITLSASEINEAEMQLPSFIATSVKQFFQATNYFEAEKKLCDSLEVSIKFIGLVVIANLLKRSNDIELPNHILQLIRKYKNKSLTVGEFLHIARDGSGVLLNTDPTIDNNHIISKIFGLFYDHSSYQERKNIREIFNALIKFRNTYSHASSTNRNAQVELQKVQHYFEQLVRELGFLSSHPLGVCVEGKIESIHSGKFLLENIKQGLESGNVYLLMNNHEPELISPFLYSSNGEIQLLDGNMAAYLSSFSDSEIITVLCSKTIELLERLISSSSHGLNLYKASSISLIGREHFIHQFKEAFKESIRQLQFVAIIGQQGVGKTKLANSYLNLVRGEGYKNVFRIKCTPNKANIPFSIVKEIIKKIGEENIQIDEAPASEFEAISYWASQWQSAAHKPTFICIDDFQWADDCSVSVIREMVELCRGSSAKGVVALTIQSEEFKEGSKVFNLMETLSHYSSDIYIKQILSPLDRNDADLLFQELLGKNISNPDFAYAVSEGNPQQLVSLLKYFHHSGLLKDAGESYELVNPSIKYFQLPQDMTNIARRKHDTIMGLFREMGIESQICDILMLLSYLDGILTSDEFMDTLLLFQQSSINADLSDSWKKAYESMQSAGIIDGSNQMASFSKQLYRYYYYWEFTKNDYRFSSHFSRKKILSLVEGKIDHENDEVNYLTKVAEAYEVLGDNQKASNQYLMACQKHLLFGEEKSALQLFDRIQLGSLPQGERCFFLKNKHQILRRLSLYNEASLCAEEIVLTSKNLQGQFEGLCCKAKSQIDLGYNDNAADVASEALTLFDGSSNNEINSSEFWPLSLILDACSRSAKHTEASKSEERIVDLYNASVANGQFSLLQSNVEHLCLAFLAIGRSAMDGGDIKRASKYLKLASGASAHIEDRGIACESKTRYGVFLFQNGSAKEGLKLINNSFQDIGEGQKQALATLLVNRAMLEININCYKEAEQDIRRCLTIYDELGLTDSVKVVDEWMHLSESLLGQKNRAVEALDSILRAEKIMSSNHSQESNYRRRGRVLKTKARAMHMAGKDHSVTYKIFQTAKKYLKEYPINYMEILSDMINIQEVVPTGDIEGIKLELIEVYKKNPWGRFENYVK